jgi:two-component system phosphate regulon sensor histidine kinase PhoR
MKPRRVFWLVFPIFVLLLALGAAGMAWYASSSTRRFYLEQKFRDLETMALLASDRLGPVWEADPGDLEKICRALGQQSDLRITVILESGKVICDSAEKPEILENHRDRPEFLRAMEGATGQSSRWSSTMGRTLLYLAIPLRREGKVAGALRVSIPAEAVEEEISFIRWKILGAGLMTALLGTLLSLLLARRIVRPLEELQSGVERFARGDLSARLPVPPVVEIAVLATTMNNMAGELEDRISAVIRQRNTLEGVLASMVEGVLAVDTEDRIILLNRTAGAIMGIDPAKAVGRPVAELFRHPDILAFVRRTLASDGLEEGELSLREGGGSHLQATGTLLEDGRGGRLGALVVLNDVTRLRRLETLRRDFVANASHEIKTPVTAIKGFVETLLEGALEDGDNARRFLEIIRVQTDRLDALVSDLLSLSRIEEEAEKGSLQRVACRLAEVVAEALEICRVKADAGSVPLEADVPGDLVVQADPLLLSQALVNLVDNAVKYSPPGSPVRVTASRREGRLEIAVADRGPGITPEHLPRLFERFYRVDRGRSREQGGTGLGLAIVKHVAQAHGGTAEVESLPGVGSTFRLLLPA